MVRVMLWAASIIGSLIVYLPLHFAWTLMGRRSPWPRHFLRRAGRSAGMRVRTVGVPIGRDVLFLSNHTSWLDIMLIAGETGAAFVSKDDVAGWPVIGWLASLNNTVFIARTERSAVRGQAEALRSALATGQPVALFPEGTTEGGADVLPFRASLLAAIYPPLPHLKVQPVAIDFGKAAREIEWVGDESALDNVKRVLRRKGPTNVTIRFLDPIDPFEVADRKALAALARREIVQALGASALGPDPL